MDSTAKMKIQSHSKQGISISEIYNNKRDTHDIARLNSTSYHTLGPIRARTSRIIDACYKRPARCAVHCCCCCCCYCCSMCCSGATLHCVSAAHVSAARGPVARVSAARGSAACLRLGRLGHDALSPLGLLAAGLDELDAVARKSQPPRDKATTCDRST